ncbi:vacuolar protein-sorting-associated protein 33 homolog [Vigna radiata var. radiata]|uniref:Vacuolar protein-sorting-associated protein 33 homolog n=1 Tax=Vigna radiata var. radiata TaxID=3916 RepID=A0A3Q0F0Y9_VIGRR|nr:vacuolar protein-sorting-associated protein 33 homolog [Vigna radiata var. radiata]
MRSEKKKKSGGAEASCRRNFEAIAWTTFGNEEGGFSNSPSFDTLGFNQFGQGSIWKACPGTCCLCWGVTFAEISALRFFSTQEGMAYDLIIAATKIVNGQTLIEPFVEKLG